MTGYAVCIVLFLLLLIFTYAELQTNYVVGFISEGITYYYHGRSTAHTIFEVLVLHLASEIKFMIGSTNIPRRKQWLVASPFISFSF